MDISEFDAIMKEKLVKIRQLEENLKILQEELMEKDRKEKLYSDVIQDLYEIDERQAKDIAGRKLNSDIYHLHSETSDNTNAELKCLKLEFETTLKKKDIIIGQLKIDLKKSSEEYHNLEREFSDWRQNCFNDLNRIKKYVKNERIVKHEDEESLESDEQPLRTEDNSEDRSDIEMLEMDEDVATDVVPNSEQNLKEIPEILSELSGEQMFQCAEQLSPCPEPIEEEFQHFNYCNENIITDNSVKSFTDINLSLISQVGRVSEGRKLQYTPQEVSEEVSFFALIKDNIPRDNAIVKASMSREKVRRSQKFDQKFARKCKSNSILEGTIKKIGNQEELAQNLADNIDKCISLTTVDELYHIAKCDQNKDLLKTCGKFMEENAIQLNSLFLKRMTVDEDQYNVLIFGFDRSRYINYIQFLIPEKFEICFTLSVSNDRKNWTIVLKNGEIWSKFWNWVYFEEKRIKFIKIHFTDMKDGQKFDKNELKDETFLCKRTNIPLVFDKSTGYLIPKHDIIKFPIQDTKYYIDDKQQLFTLCMSKSNIKRKYKNYFYHNIGDNDFLEFYLSQTCMIDNFLIHLWDKDNRCYDFKVEVKNEKEDEFFLIKDGDQTVFKNKSRKQLIRLGGRRAVRWIKLTGIRGPIYDTEFAIIDIECPAISINTIKILPK